MNSERYAARGVSASKDEVHQAIKNLDKGLYPNAFCKILPDVVGGNSDFCNIMHADTAGTKTSLAYMYWKETGDISVWDGIAQDAIVMNIDDMGCVGVVDDIILSSTIGRNKHLITGEVISRIINAAVSFCDQLREYGVSIHLAGGETADVGDIVRTIDVGYTTFARVPREKLIINDIQPGQVIIGFASDGQAVYEDEYNGGMGSNGLTSARHDVFASIYQSKYPEAYDPNTDKRFVFSGSKLLEESVTLPNGATTTMGKLVLSPTRTYMPLIANILKGFTSNVHGIIHCSGGAQTKVLKFADKVKIVKNSLFDMPVLFDLIQQESGTSQKEMYEVFNMGHRLEMYVDAEVADDIIAISKALKIDAKIIGHVEAADSRSVEITDQTGTYTYTG